MNLIKKNKQKKHFPLILKEKRSTPSLHHFTYSNYSVLRVTTVNPSLNISLLNDKTFLLYLRVS